MEIVRSNSGVMGNWVMFSKVIHKIFLTWVPMNGEMLLCDLICTLKVSYFYGSEHFLLTVSFAIPVVELSQ